MKLAKVAAALFSGGLLLVGMLYFFAIAGSKFGTLADRETYALVANLRELRLSEVGYEAAFDRYLEVPPCPDDTPEPAFCPSAPVGAYDGLYWRPEKHAGKGGRYWVELDPAVGFVAHGTLGEHHYVVRGPDAEPAPLE